MRKVFQLIAITSLIVLMSITPTKAQSLDYHLNWELTGYGTGPGRAGIEISTQSLPYPELLLTLSVDSSLGPQKIGCMSFEPDSGEYQQKWTHITKVDDDTENFGMIAFFHNEFDMFPREVIVCLYGRMANLAIIDKETGDPFIIHHLNVELVSDAKVADYNNDGVPDLFVVNQYGVGIYDIISGQILNSFDKYDPTQNARICVGQFDHDESLEMAFRDGQIINVDTAEVQWDLVNTLYSPQCCDVDQDGLDELVCICNSGLCVFDVEQKKLKWLHSGLNTGDLLLACDMSADGTMEIVTVQMQFREDANFVCYNGKTGEVIWEFPTEIDECYRIAVGDFDMDNTDELFVTTTPGYYGILDPAASVIEWEQYLYGNFSHMTQVSDFDNDGALDLGIIAVKKNFGDTNESYLQILDTSTHRQKSQVLIAADIRVSTIQTADFIAELPGNEHLILGSNNKKTCIRLLDSNYTNLWEQSVSKTAQNYVKYADLDGDGDLEIVVLNQNLSTFDATTGENIDQYTLPTEFELPHHLNVRDINNDGGAEIGLIYDYHNCLILDGHTLETKFYIENEDDFTYLLFAELRPDIPGTEIVLRTHLNNDLFVMNGITHEHLYSVEISIDDMSYYKSKDINDDGVEELLATTYWSTYILDNQGQVLWLSPTRNGGGLDFNVISVSDYNADGAQEMLFSSYFKLFEYRLGGPAPTPTPEPCFNPGVRLEMADDNLLPGDPFALDAHLCNATNSMQYNHHLLVALSFGGSYWFLPSWIDANISFDDYTFSIPVGEYSVPIIRELTWPDIGQTISGLSFIAGLMNPMMTQVIGEIDTVEFIIGN